MSISLLQRLIETPSFSREEIETANKIEKYLQNNQVKTHRIENNIWTFNKYFDENLPTILLNSHHDTVRPVEGWTRDPFKPSHEDGKIYGLGSNDAGASLVGLINAFLFFYNHKNLKYNLLLAATAEEEISGANGIALLLKNLPPNLHIAFGIVGEPTNMQMAIAEKGLMVVDAVAHGKAGHAAREEGINAIYVALKDIEKIINYKFPKISPLLGAVKMSVTQIEAGRQHNVVPDHCRFVIDVRSNECYTNNEIFDILKPMLQSDMQARSFRLNSSQISENHPFILGGRHLGLSTFGSPTLSDQSLMNFETVKIGIGDSARSHTADEFVFESEILEGCALYIKLLEQIL
ncbi:MAG: hypothetical protein RL757_1548 [Bacteroidota bacterium]|jgi:acetylornithine deacetylase